MKKQILKKSLVVLTLLGAVSASAGESNLRIPTSQEQTQERQITELERQEALALQAEYQKKSIQNAEWREHQKVLNYIDRHDRN